MQAIMLLKSAWEQFTSLQVFQSIQIYILGFVVSAIVLLTVKNTAAKIISGILFFGLIIVAIKTGAFEGVMDKLGYGLRF